MHVVCLPFAVQVNFGHVTCHNCGQKGHKARDCRKRPSQSKGRGKGKANDKRQRVAGGASDKESYLDKIKALVAQSEKK